LKKFLNIIRKVTLWFFAITFLWVLLFRFINPPISYLMVQRGFERKAEGKDWKIEKSWVDIEDLSNNLKIAALAGEDANFLNHWGFDFKAMGKALEKNQKGKTLRGGSTISQQTAKNVFLWPGRSYIRKAFEAYFTVLIELLWGKERILEVYLNVIEMGDGIYGAEAATQKYFGKSAHSMSKSQAALIIAVLPNPRRWSPARPTRFVYYKQGLILRNMRNLQKLPF
jgi:monofunctional biosynthetic peptidoglycan transglycosylase